MKKYRIAPRLRYQNDIIVAALRLYRLIVNFDPATALDLSANACGSVGGEFSEPMRFGEKLDHEFVGQVSEEMEMLRSLTRQYTDALSQLDPIDRSSLKDTDAMLDSLIARVDGNAEFVVHHREMSVMSKACESFARYHSLQFELVWDSFVSVYMWKIVPKLWDCHRVEDLISPYLSKIREVISHGKLNGGAGTGFGLGHKEIAPAGAIAWDMYEQFRHELWKANPNRTSCTVDSHGAYNWYKPVGLPVIEAFD
jgi:hypothetical protein